MDNKQLSLFEIYFTEDVLNELQEELLQSSSGPVFKKFYEMYRDFLDKNEIWDACSARIVTLFCWLIDHNKKDELLRLLKIHPFWGGYATGEDELAPVCYAIHKHKTGIAKDMICIMAREYSLFVHESFQPGYIAVQEQQYDLVRLLLDYEVPEDYFAGQYTGLQLAVQLHDLDAARIFVEYNHDVNKMAITKTPPLTMAVANNDLPMVEYLLAQPKIDVNNPGVDGKNAVEHATSDPIRHLLLQKGAVPSSENIKLICAAVRAAIDFETEKLNAITGEILAMENASTVSGDFDLLYYTVKYDQFTATKMLIESGIVDLGNYEHNLFGLLSYYCRKDRHQRTGEERLMYMRLFDQNGYRFLFPANDTYEHNIAAYQLALVPDPAQREEARGILERAGVSKFEIQFTMDCIEMK